MSRTDAHRPWQFRVQDNLDPFFSRDPLVAALMSDHPPRWYLVDLWWSPERQRTRRAVQAVARDYNAHGEVDDLDLASYGANRSLRGDWL